MAPPRTRVSSPWNLLAMLCALMLCQIGSGEEPAAAMLDALRENQYYDEALAYLGRLEVDPLTPPAFREEIDYQRGVTLVQAASTDRDRSVREGRLNAAKESLEKFLRDRPDHPRNSSARRQFGFLMREWARMKVAQARRTTDAAMLKEAADLFDQAHKVFSDATAELKGKLEGLPKELDPEATKRRDAMRAEYVDSQLRAAEMLEDKAETEPPESPEQKKLLEDAGKLYGGMFGKYSNYLAGVQARLNQARVTKKLGDPDTAVKYLTESVLNQDENSPALRRLKTQALLLAMDVWMDQSRKDYPTAITRATAWLDQIRPAEANEPDWVLLRLQLAKANSWYAQQLEETSPRDPLIKSSRDAARKLARAVSRIPGDYQDEGRQLLAGLPGGVPGAKVDERPAAETFEAAKTYATDAIAEMQTAELLRDASAGRLREEKDDQGKQEWRDKLRTAEEAVSRNREMAVTNLQLALQLADAETPIEDLNLVRRLLAYLSYIRGDYYDAAVLAEFVSRRFPGVAGAQVSAQLALAAYLKLYDAATSEEKTFETEHIVSLANFIVDTWSGSPEAAEAVNTLIPFLIRRGDLAKARQYVEGIPANSPQRGSAELRIGEALWRDYLIGMSEIRQWEREAREPDADVAALNAQVAKRKPELEQVRATALAILDSGVARMKDAGGIDATVPRAVLALAQIHVDIDDAAKAIALLDDDKIGVLPMIQRKDPVVDAPDVRERAYYVALSAFVSALPKVAGTQERATLVERSREMIQKLRQEIGDAPEGQKRLVQIFYSLARGLETQINLLDRPEDRRILSEGFSTFLEQVRAEANDLSVLNWVAESYYSLGSGLADDQGSSEAAKKCYQSAIETYDQILGGAEQGPEIKRQLTIRKARVQRAMGDYEVAAKVFAAVLAEDSRTLETQVEAARTYQMWGAVPQQARRYLEAIAGTQPDAKTQENLVWGWIRISRVTQRYKQYRDTFHEARYNTAVCHYKYALRLKQKADRDKYLTLARNDIDFTQRVFPSMGGDAWRAKYDALLKTIQRALSEQPLGLSGAGNKK